MGEAPAPTEEETNRIVPREQIQEDNGAQLHIQPIQNPYQTSLKVLQLNCGKGGLDQMGTKLAQLKLYLYRANADIVLLQET